MHVQDDHCAPRRAAPPHDFSPAAVMARADAFAAEQAERAAARLRPVELRPAAEILATIAAEIEVRTPEPPRPASDSPTAAQLLDLIARELDRVTA